MFLSELLAASGKVLRLLSPNYPESYQNNAYHLWNIRGPTNYAIHLDIINIDIEKDTDYVYVGDGANKYDYGSGKWIRISGGLSENWNRKEILNTSTVYMIFTSDGKTTGDGFSIECTVTESDFGSITTTEICKHATFSSNQCYQQNGVYQYESMHSLILYKGA